MHRILLLSAAAFICAGMCSPSAYPQNTEGRWSVGFQGGANYWMNDNNVAKIGPGANVLVKYGIDQFLSVGLSAGYHELKTEQVPMLAGMPDKYLKLKSFPVSANAYVHFLPHRLIAPYAYVGIGAMGYQRVTGLGVAYPDNSMRFSILVPAGAGVEAYVAKDIAASFELGFRLISDRLDLRSSSSPDGFSTAKFGLNYYLGSGDADDDDSDGLTNGEERRFGTDPNTGDTDGDGLKDGEEVKRYHTNPLKPDTDGDGLPDGDEVLKYHTDPTKFDTDGDGLSDGDEILKYHTDPLKGDTDGDGLSDGDEVQKYHTDPLKVDTDGDGLSDGDEVKTYKTDPNKADTDGDGLTDGDEVKKLKTNPLIADTDGGGLNDGAEVTQGTNPLDPKDDHPVATMELIRGKSVILDGVNFTSASANLTVGSEGMLEKAFAALAANRDVAVEIAGYTDDIGDRAANERLSLQRAQAVKAWLVKRGIAASRITTAGLGMRSPIAPNDTPQGRAKNRRIEFHVK